MYYPLYGTKNDGGINLKKALQKYLSEHLLISVILLNLVYLAINLLLYDPVWHPDDYYIAADLYGVYTGTYNSNPIYTTALYGNLLAFFMNLCGSMPWYTILSYIWVFMSLCLVSYVVLSHNRTKISWLIVNIIVLYFSFEGYMCMQWTKTSAIAMGAGLFAFVFPMKKRWVRVPAIMLFLIGGLIRTENVRMAIGAFGLTCGLLFLFYILKGNFDLAKISFLNAVKVLVLYLGFNLLVSTSSSMLVEKSEELDIFNQWSGHRVNAQDYGIPSYAENKDIYDKYNIIEEELDFIHNWGFDVYNFELYEKVSLAKAEINQQAISQVGGSKVAAFFKTAFDSLHTFPISFLKMDVFYCYIILVVVLLFYSKNKDGLYFVGFTFVLLWALNVYLYISGRYLMHRVDVGVIFNICLILLYLFMHQTSDFVEKSIDNKILFLILLFLIVTPARNFYDDRDRVSQEDIANNKIFYANTVEDEHFYLFVNTRNSNDRKSYGFDIYDIPQKGLQKNTFGLIMAPPNVQSVIESLGVEDPYLDIIDGTDMYLVTGENDTMLQEVIKYIEKKSGKSVNAVCVKKFLGKSLYRVNSKDITDVYDFTNATEDITKVNEDLQITLKKGKLKVSGSVYIEGENDFYQNVYIDIVDSQSENHQLFYTRQTRNEEFEVGESGWCSNISAKIKLPEFYDKEDKIYLMIETLDTTYRYQISN